MDMHAIFIVAAGDKWHKIVTGNDARNAFTNARRENKTVTGIAATLYVANEVVSQRLVAQAIKRLELDGVRIDRRWAGCDAERLQQVIVALGGSLGCKVLTPGQRLNEAIRRTDARAKRAGV